MALAFPAARPRQLSLYPHEIRKRCIHQRLNLGLSYEAIAASYGNRPSARSIKVWVKEAIQQGTIPVHLDENQAREILCLCFMFFSCRKCSYTSEPP